MHEDHPIPLGSDRVEAEPMQGRLYTAEQVERFMMSGNATLTVISLRTGTRFTYKVKRPDDFKPERPSWFVSVLNGSDNEHDFAYIGLITGAAEPAFRLTKGSKLADSAPSVVAFSYFSRFLFMRDAVSPLLEVWHEGRCGRCGRKLTVPESVEQGFGPECINHV